MKTAQDAVFALQRLIALAPGNSALCSSDAATRVSPAQLQLVVDYLKTRIANDCPTVFCTKPWPCGHARCAGDGLSCPLCEEPCLHTEREKELGRAPACPTCGDKARRYTQPAPALCPRCDMPHSANVPCYNGAPNW